MVQTAAYITRSVGQGGGARALPRQAYHSLAKCVAAVVAAGGSDALDITRGFLRDAAHPPSDTHHMFALLALAEIGRRLCVAASLTYTNVM